MLRMRKIFPTFCGPGLAATNFNFHSIVNEWTILFIILIIPMVAVNGNMEEKNKNCKLFNVIFCSILFFVFIFRRKIFHLQWNSFLMLLSLSLFKIFFVFIFIFNSFHPASPYFSQLMFVDVNDKK